MPEISSILLSKREQMLQVLSQAIEAGDYAVGDRIPSEAELSTRYGVSKNTIREAVSALVQRGLLERVQGSGTYVTTRAVASAVRSCGLFVHARGHVHEPQTRQLVSELQRRQVIPMMFDLDELRPQEPDSTADMVLLNALEQGMGCAIVEGTAPWFLQSCAKAGRAVPPMITINFGYPDKAPDQSFVLTNLEQGMYLATRHLASLGHSRITMLTYRNTRLASGQAPADFAGHYGDLARGYEKGLPPGARPDYFYVDDRFRIPADRERLIDLLSGRQRPTAIVASEDFFAKHVVTIAFECGLDVPGELAVVGYYNTPWVEHLQVPLTSVSIREEEIARLAVEQLLDGEKGDARVTRVELELVIRASCGYGRS